MDQHNMLGVFCEQFFSEVKWAHRKSWSLHHDLLSEIFYVFLFESFLGPMRAACVKIRISFRQGSSKKGAVTSPRWRNG
jgi:hypothetical protein